MQTIFSKQFSLQKRDIIRGLVIAVLTSAVTIVQETFQKGELSLDWNLILTASLSGGVAYILKNFLEPTKVIITSPEEENLK